MSKPCTVYTAHAMSGRSGKELILESRMAKTVLWQYGIKVLDPVEVEGVSEKDVLVQATETDLRAFWKRDKEMIRQSDVVLDLTGAAKSEGVAHEIGYARYCLWIPVIRLYPGLMTSVARFEDDYIVNSLEEAGQLIRSNWGTYSKRLSWRVKMLGRSLPRWIFRQIVRFGQ